MSCIKDLEPEQKQHVQASQLMFVLLTIDGACRGIYSNEHNLSNGVNHWINQFPNETLAYECWKLNYPSEPRTWDWAYIASSHEIEDLLSGGGNVPSKDFWGKNLVGIDWPRS